MMRFLDKKMVAVALTTGLVLGGGGVAFAYFNSTGTGTGTASVGTPSNDFIFTTAGPDTLYPGAGPQSFNVTATNNGLVPEHVGIVPVSLMVSGTGVGQVVTDHLGVAIDGCLSSWFAISSSATMNQTVAAGASYTLSTSEPTISLDESGTDQTACAGHSVGIQFGTPN